MHVEKRIDNNRRESRSEKTREDKTQNGNEANADGEPTIAI